MAEQEEEVIPEANQGNIDAALQLLSSGDAQEVAQGAEQVGTLCREVQYRSPFGESTAIQLMAQALAAEPCSQAGKNIVRAFANLCFDHGENRVRIRETGAVPHVVTVLRNKDSEGQRFAAAAIANMSSESPELVSDLFDQGVVPLLVACLDNNDDAGVLCMSCRALSNMSDNPDVRTAVQEAQGGSRLVALLRHDVGQVVVETATAITSLGASITFCTDVVANNVVDACVSGLRGGVDEESQPVLAELLAFLADKEPVCAAMGTEDNLRTLFALMMQLSAAGEAAPKDALDGVAKALSLLSLDDDVMLRMFQRYEQWIDRMVDTEENVAVRVAATMIVANCARRDDHCDTMLQRGVLDALQPLVEKPSVRLQHLSLGALHNLLLPQANRLIIAEAGFIKSRMVSPPQGKPDPYDDSTSRVDDSLTIQGMFWETDAWEILLDIKEGLEAEQARVWLEVGRLMSVLARHPDHRLQLVQARDGLGLTALCDMLEGEWVVLQVEAATGVGALAAEAQVIPLLVEAGLHERLLTILASKNEAAQLSSVFALNNILLDADVKAKLADSVRSALAEVVVASEFERVRTVAEQLRDSLTASDDADAGATEATTDAK